MLGLGRASEGGGWGYWFCAECNGKTGKWDEEFIKWQRAILGSIARHRPRVGQVLHFGLRSPDPGAFARCLWGWMFALDPSLLDNESALAEAVREGTSVTPPVHLRLLVAVTTARDIWLTNPGTGAIGFDLSGEQNGWWLHPSKLWAPTPPAIELPYAVVAAPPFNVVLADARHDHGLQHFDASDWVAEPAGKHRDVLGYLPVVRVARAPSSPTPVTYKHIVTSESVA